MIYSPHLPLMLYVIMVLISEGVWKNPFVFFHQMNMKWYFENESLRGKNKRKLFFIIVIMIIFPFFWVIRLLVSRAVDIQDIDIL